MGATKSIEKVNRHVLADEDAIAEGLWLRNQIAGLGINMAEFARISGLDFRGVVARVGKKLRQNSKHYCCLSVDEVKVVGHELGIPALYILIAFNYPGYSVATHIKDYDVKAKDAIANIRNLGRHLVKNPPENQRKGVGGRPPKKSIKDDPFYGFAKGLEAEETKETVDVPVVEEGEEEPVTEPKIEFVKDEDSETIYIPVHIGAFRKQLREKFTEDVTVNAKFDTDHVAIDISSKKLGIEKHYDMSPWDIEAVDSALIISALFQQDVINILFKKEGESVD